MNNNYWDQKQYYEFLEKSLKNGFYTEFYYPEEFNEIIENIRQHNIDGIPEGLALRSAKDYLEYNSNYWDQKQYYEFLEKSLKNGFYTEFYNPEEFNEIIENIRQHNIDGIPEGLELRSAKDYLENNGVYKQHHNVQSILFDRKIWNLQNAKKWLLKNNYKVKFENKQPHITKNFIRFRQLKPIKNNEYRIHSIGNGIDLILEYKR